MIKLKKSIFVVVFLLLSIGCKREYEENIAYIYETKFVHYGRGYYKLRVFYRFEYNDSIYKGDNFTKGLYRNYSKKRYKERDRIIIQYPKGKPAKNIIKKKTNQQDFEPLK
jgi:hypothetical protein